VRNSKTRLSDFALRLSGAWKDLALPSHDGTVIVAVSGGADSTALLLGLEELIRSGKLAVKLVVAHLNHCIRLGRSDEDAQWVAELGDQLGIEVIVGREPVKEWALKTLDNLEQAGRSLRYRFLAEVAEGRAASFVLTGHTMDDQAETVLLRLLRGSGLEGLSGMHPVRPLESGRGILLARPLLKWARRLETQEYCRHRRIDFRVDETNADHRFARARVRSELVPLIQSFNPRAVEALSRMATLLRGDSAALTAQAVELLGRARDNPDNHSTSDPPSLSVCVLQAALPAIRRRALRLWLAQCRGDLRRLERVHILAVEGLLTGLRGGRVAQLPGGEVVTRRRGVLRFYASDSLKGVEKGRTEA
jgi:tRNA(Ile)-lysidine synthase